MFWEICGNSLGLQAFTAKGVGSIPGLGTKIPRSHKLHSAAKRKREKKKKHLFCTNAINCAFFINVQLYISVFYLLCLEKVKTDFENDHYYMLCIINVIKSNVMDKLTSPPTGEFAKQSFIFSVHDWSQEIEKQVDREMLPIRGCMSWLLVSPPICQSSYSE